MIIITGAAGMIGSVTAWHFNEILKEDHLILCDDLANENKEKNFHKRNYKEFIQKNQFFSFIKQIPENKIDGIIHLASFPRQKVVSQNPILAANVMGTGLVHLLELAKKFKIPKLNIFPNIGLVTSFQRSLIKYKSKLKFSYF